MQPAPRRGEETGWPSYARVVCAAAAAPPSAVLTGVLGRVLNVHCSHSAALQYIYIIRLYNIMVTYTTRTGNGLFVYTVKEMFTGIGMRRVCATVAAAAAARGGMLECLKNSAW